MIDSFILRIVLAGVGVALAAGPLGCVVLWRRMIYFGDTVSHAALLGVALALAVGLPIVLGILVVAFSVVFVMLAGEGRAFHTDTLLGVAAHGALAVGIIALSFGSGGSASLMQFLTGDILSVTWEDVAVIWIGALCALAVVVWRWNALLLTSINRDLAFAKTLNPLRESLLFTLALAVLVAVAINAVGALLITAMLIIPAATARLFSSTPEKMALLAAVIGALSAVGGIAASVLWDTPTGASIVVAALAILIVASPIASFLGRT